MRIDVVLFHAVGILLHPGRGGPLLPRAAARPATSSSSSASKASSRRPPWSCVLLGGLLFAFPYTALFHDRFAPQAEPLAAASGPEAAVVRSEEPAVYCEIADGGSSPRTARRLRKSPRASTPVRPRSTSPGSARRSAGRSRSSSSSPPPAGRRGGPNATGTRGGGVAGAARNATPAKSSALPGRSAIPLPRSAG